MIKITKDLRSDVPWVKGKSREVWKSLLLQIQSCVQSPCRQKLVEITLDPEQNQTYRFLFLFFLIFSVSWQSAYRRYRQGSVKEKMLQICSPPAEKQVFLPSFFFFFLHTRFPLQANWLLSLYSYSVRQSHNTPPNQKDVNFLQVRSLLIGSSEAASAETGTHQGRK